MQRTLNQPQESMLSFDGKDVTKYCVPKLIEIEMQSGVFEVGKTGIW